MSTPILRSICILAMASWMLAGCSSLSPEVKLRRGLMEAGLSPPLSECMAEKMADRLSVPQLRKLQSLASLRKSAAQEMTVDRFLHKVRAIEDPEIFIVSSKAALSCSL